MKEIVNLQKKIIPEMIEILEKRYNILRSIYYNEPIGRRTIAARLDIGERVVRTEVNVLKKQGLLEIKSSGMHITEEGKELIDQLKEFMHALKDLNTLEEKLEKKLNIKKVIIVPGSYDEDEHVIKDIGKRAAKFISDIVKNGNIIGVTGGTTMANVVEEIPPLKDKKDVLVLPARGGLGKYVETQSNNIAAKLAQRLGGKYKLLHVPDNIGKEALETLLQVPEINNVIKTIKNINVLVFGIGRADVMAKRRKLRKEVIDKLMERGAVAEAFGYYFNTEGKKVWESSTVGLSLCDFKEIDTVIGVAGGTTKAEAIIAISTLRNDMTLITDEGAAKKILSIVN
ncbi:sugar-binding transcriptional regulator [Thermohalobacter berrensis]|uniref:Cro/Cl family transcriptional regulator n=1 Tax=Thermohalobacter berrensis TaxID=99594 RepID=A0A419SV65_9FIRM|nr:sugar-binding domain-containing protein [Thermohalobacter berrensis]RKD29110.1 Cro/Cl family transcriptional regulator [Thermohalobacter berrensis]